MDLSGSTFTRRLCSPLGISRLQFRRNDNERVIQVATSLDKTFADTRDASLDFYAVPPCPPLGSYLDISTPTMLPSSNAVAARRRTYPKQTSSSSARVLVIETASEVRPLIQPPSSRSRIQRLASLPQSKNSVTTVAADPSGTN